MFQQTSKNHESGLKSKVQQSFLSHFKVFGCLIKLLKLIVKCGENEGKKLPKSVQIKTGYQILHQGILIMSY